MEANQNITKIKRMDYHDRINIFARYLGCTVRIKKSKKWGSIRGVYGERVFVQLASDPNGKSANPDFCNTDIVLLLKSLGNISDEDSLEIAKYWYYPWGSSENKNAIERVKSDLLDSTIVLPIQSADYLRERGYALPYKNWSVDELVNFGIYKLIE